MLETFDSVATELLSIPVAVKKRPSPAAQAAAVAVGIVAPGEKLPLAAATAGGEVSLMDADGDVDLVGGKAQHAQKRKKQSHGEKHAKRKLQKQRAKHIKQRRSAARAKPRNR